MIDLIWAQNSWDEYQYFVEKDRRNLKKINRLIKELRRSGDPACGEGSPEPLKGDLSGWWSKRINEKDRLVYAIEDCRLVIAQCGSHYGDK